MALCSPVSLFSLLFALLLLFSASSFAKHDSVSFSFPLRSLPLSAGKPLKTNPKLRSLSSASYNVKWPFKYSMALVVSLPIGTPPQHQQMVLDTGSQLSWIQCHNKTPPTASFDPSLSSSFYVIPCTHPLCKPRVPDFTLPTTCDQNRLCHYSYFYADGTYAEGNLVREKLTFSPSQTTPPLTLGCATESRDAGGILGMNLGRLSFPSQAKITKFSYCVPTRQSRSGNLPTGSFYLGNNPNSGRFRYVSMLTFSQSQRMPNLDPLAYTVPMQGIRIGGKRLNINPSVFRPDAGGSGQTMIDSGSEFTFLVDEAYDRVREEPQPFATLSFPFPFPFQSMAGEDHGCDKNIAVKNAFINYKSGSQDFKDATITTPAVESAFLNKGSGRQDFSRSKIECGPSIWEKFKRLFNYDGTETKKYGDFPEHPPAELTQNIPSKPVEVVKRSSSIPKSNHKTSTSKR